MLRLGIFDFVNIWPVYSRFLFEGVSGVSLSSGTPSVLNLALKNGELEASCISSAEYPLLQSGILLLPSLALATRGEVRSVFLATRAPIREISGGKIFATSASSTSVLLLRILLKEYGVKAQIVPSANPGEDFKNGGDGFLIIGDEALRFGAFFKPGNGMLLHDLGELWHHMTGKPFVWAVWGIRRESRENGHIGRLLLESRESGLRRLGEIASRAAERLSLPPVFLETYFRNFSYELGSDEKEGLLLFYSMAADHQWIPRCGKLEFAEAEEASACS